MFGYNNKLVTDDVNILGCTDGDLLENTLGAEDRNTIGIVGGNEIGSTIGSFDGYGFLDGKQLGWSIGKN